MSLNPLRDARSEARKKAFKKAVDGDEARRKREDQMLSIRKSTRDENLLKKRNIGLQSQLDQSKGPTVDKKVSDNDLTCAASSLRRELWSRFWW